VRRAPLVLLGLALTGAPASLSAQGKYELRLAGVAVFAQRSAMFAGSVGTGSSMMPGVEVLVRHRYAGLTGRLYGGTFSADSGSEAVGKLHAGEIRALAGPRFLAVDLGYSRRAFTGAFGGRSWPFARLGALCALQIGASGLSAEFMVAYYAGLGGSGDGGGSGREAETRLVYTPNQLPIYAALGYRYQRFSVASIPGGQPEELSGVIIAAGVRFGL
jgi:hypothetical protein